MNPCSGSCGRSVGVRSSLVDHGLPTSSASTPSHCSGSGGGSVAQLLFELKIIIKSELSISDYLVFWHLAGIMILVLEDLFYLLVQCGWGDACCHSSGRQDVNMRRQRLIDSLPISSVGDSFKLSSCGCQISSLLQVLLLLLLIGLGLLGHFGRFLAARWRHWHGARKIRLLTHVTCPSRADSSRARQEHRHVG